MTDPTKVERLYACYCADTMRVATNGIGGECPVHGGDACLKVGQFIPAQEVERLERALRELVEAVEPHVPRKHDTACPLHIMHDDVYENPEPSDDPPQPRACHCGFDRTSAALSQARETLGPRKVAEAESSPVSDGPFGV